jgi:hypothetical protein
MSTTKIEKTFLSVIEEAYKISLDAGKQVEKMLEQGIQNPLGIDEERKLLKKAIAFMRTSAEKRGDSVAMENLNGDVDEIVDGILSNRRGNTAKNNGATTKKKRVELVARNGVQPGPVKPIRRFHMREVPMNCGYVKTTDINLWEDNVRLDIHLGQFKNKFGRDPESNELLELMLSNIKLPGIGKNDEFEIAALAESIAINGVRVPPIIDIDGTLLDGNRRVTACYYILNSEDFDSDQKRKVEYLFVHQLTEHATDEDRESVIVSLNFEDDLKKSWPEYVKARKVYDEWQAMVATEPRRPSPQHEREMKRALSAKFALGPKIDKVNRYIKMVEWATSFEDYLVVEQDIEEYEVKHKANEKFQYFDELSKGAVSEGGVAYTLDRDEKLKKLVFDLLFQDKIKNWDLIRDLKYVGMEDRDQLAKALDMPAEDETRDYVEKILTDARDRSKEARVVGANQRIKTFVAFLKKLPIGSFSDPNEISTESLQNLLDGLRLAEKLARPALEKRLKK